MDGGGDLEFSQEKGVGNLSESCIIQKMRLEVKPETAVNRISEKNSRACFVLFCFLWCCKSLTTSFAGGKKQECCQVWVT